jgi:transposase-like protein
MRNRVERFFRHLKERTAVFHHKLSARDHVQGINNLKLFLNPTGHNSFYHAPQRTI